MTTVASGYSFYSIPSDGVTDTFPLQFALGVLKLAYVLVYVDGEVDGDGAQVYRQIEGVPGDPGMVKVLGPVVPAGTRINFQRVVPKDLLIHLYSNGSVLDYPSLDESHKQLAMMMHEVLDGIGLKNVFTDLNMNGFKITNIYVDLDDPDSIATIGALGTYRNDAAQSAADAESAAVQADNSATAAASSASTAYTAAATAIAARDAAQAATAATEAARDTALADITSAQTAGVTAVNTAASTKLTEIGTAGAVAVDNANAGVTAVNNAVTAGVASVNGTRDAAIAAITALPDYAKDYDQILRDQTNALLAGTAVGTEGKWKLLYAGTVTPNKILMHTRSSGVVTAVFNSFTVNGLPLGDTDAIDVALAIRVVGNSGTVYSASFAYLAAQGTAVSHVDVHPKHGDVRWDFTSGTAYPVFVVHESTAVQDQQTGDLNVLEYFVGGKSARAPAFPGVPYLDFEASKAAAAPPFFGGGSVVSKPVTVTVRYLYDAVSPTLTVQCKVDATQTWEYAVHDVPMTYDPNTGTATYTGTITASGAYSEQEVQVHCDYGKLRDPQSESLYVIEATVGGATGRGTFTQVRNSTNTNATYVQNDVHAPTVQRINDVIGGTGSLGTLNTGYWDGKTWQSQLLGDAVKATGGVQLDLSRESLGLSDAAHVASVQVRNAAGAWVPFTYSVAPLTQYKYYAQFSRNRIVLSTTASWSALGYASEDAMLTNSAVKVAYTTKARRLRPMQRPTSIRALGTVLYSNDHFYFNGGLLNYECTGNISKSRTIPNMFCYVPLASWNLTPDSGALAQWGYPVSHAVVALSGTYSCGYKALFLLYEQGGTLRIAVCSKELVHDGDWGDDGAIPISNRVITVTDDNGNTVLLGAYGYDTGIPA